MEGLSKGDVVEAFHDGAFWAAEVQGPPQPEAQEGGGTRLMVQLVVAGEEKVRLHRVAVCASGTKGRPAVVQLLSGGVMSEVVAGETKVHDCM